MYLLDTNFCIEILNRKDSLAAKKLTSVSPSVIRLCSVVKAELFHGAYKGGRDSNINLVRNFCSMFVSLPLDDRAAETYGQIRSELEKQGKLIGPNDLLIASIAIAHNTTLITHNVSEFSRILNLKIEDWQV